MPELEIRNLHVRAGDKDILRGLDLTVGKGEIHALMGPNGSGKSTLANAVMGHPGLEVTEGFSGGEKKRMEILQLALQKPELAILDETDSGLDIDALRVVANGVNAVAGPDMGVLIITHYQRILHLVQPSHVHVMFQGRIVREGGPELVDALEAKGYAWITDEIEKAA